MLLDESSKLSVAQITDLCPDFTFIEFAVLWGFPIYIHIYKMLNRKSSKHEEVRIFARELNYLEIKFFFVFFKLQNLAFHAAQRCNWDTVQVATCSLTSSVLDRLVQTELMTGVNMINVIHPTSFCIPLTCAAAEFNWPYRRHVGNIDPSAWEVHGHCFFTPNRKREGQGWACGEQVTPW